MFCMFWYNLEKREGKMLQIKHALQQHRRVGFRRSFIFSHQKCLAREKNVWTRWGVLGEWARRFESGITQYWMKLLMVMSKSLKLYDNNFFLWHLVYIIFNKQPFGSVIPPSYCGKKWNDANIQREPRHHSSVSTHSSELLSMASWRLNLFLPEDAWIYLMQY